MSGYPGSLSVAQEAALQELKDKVLAWADKEKSENKKVVRDREAQAQADADAEAEAEAGGGSKDDGDEEDPAEAGADVPQVQAEGGGQAVAGVPPIPTYCSNAEVEAQARSMIKDDGALLRFLRARDFDVAKA